MELVLVLLLLLTLLSGTWLGEVTGAPSLSGCLGSSLTNFLVLIAVACGAFLAGWILAVRCGGRHARSHTGFPDAHVAPAAHDEPRLD